VTIVAFHVFQYVQATGTAINPVAAFLSKFETVDLLFVMSAYLLTLSYARAAINQTPALPAREFLFRRAVRIVPLYVVGISVVWAIRNPALPGDLRDLVEHLLFLQVFDRERIFYTIGPTWSMSLEVLFYVVLVLLAPLAVRACSRIDSRRRRAVLLLVATMALWVLPALWNSVAFLVAHVPFDDWPVYFGPQARFGAFASGMTLAVVVAARDGRPMLRGAGLPWDLRKSQPYSGYETYEFEVPTRTTCDTYGRYSIRMDEVDQSLRIIEQCVDRLAGTRPEQDPWMIPDAKVGWPARLSLGPDGMGPSPEHIAHIMGQSMEALIHHFKLVTEGFRVPAGQAYVPIESPKGELGCHVVSDGGTRPYRAHLRDPSFHHLQTLAALCEGAMLADVIPAIASIDPVIGGVDR